MPITSTPIDWSTNSPGCRPGDPVGRAKGEIRRDPILRRSGVKVEAQSEGPGRPPLVDRRGDVVLYTSTDVPTAESHVWNPIFERMLTSLEITREDELAIRQLAEEVLVHLQGRHPEEHFRLDEKGIRATTASCISATSIATSARPRPVGPKSSRTSCGAWATHGPVDRPWDLVEAQADCSPCGSPGVTSVPRPWARAFSSTNGSTTS